MLVFKLSKFAQSVINYTFIFMFLIILTYMPRCLFSSLHLYNSCLLHICSLLILKLDFIVNISIELYIRHEPTKQKIRS